MRPLMLCLTCLCVALGAVRAEAGQPFSESLVDCAALFTISNRAYPERRHAGKGLALEQLGETFLAAAEARARAEGRTDPTGYICDLEAEKTAAWDSRGAFFVFSEEFRDWTSYCRSLSDHLGISLPR
ncbi:hypothetical protein R3X27_07110 [Tropicimonas sp. TH_r6]|uniref:hypothetical protein n=1 Tax=Tropicimonas sp. TH_r6 TaxID=3082085 RepID=UPI002954D0C7|nr:hypothetical protein [Tropicimonas sp. TH_r6]MDV7142449.1 hypothetical protein [Tropicimonas sp. TH_r6]